MLPSSIFSLRRGCVIKTFFIALSFCKYFCFSFFHSSLTWLLAKARKTLRGFRKLSRRSTMTRPCLKISLPIIRLSTQPTLSPPSCHPHPFSYDKPKAENGWNSWKWLKVLKIAEKCWKCWKLGWLNNLFKIISYLPGNCWKWLKMAENAENGWKCWFIKIITLTYLPAFSAFVSNFSSFSHFQLSAYHRKKGEGDMRVR